MSELVGGAAAAETLGGSAAEAGALMRRAREALGLRIEVLAASLKVSVAKLEALEAGQLESLSDRVFVRALAASVCRHVKLNPELVLSKLPAASQTPWASPKTATNTAVKHNEGHPRRSWFEYLSRPVVLAVLALLVGAALITNFLTIILVALIAYGYGKLNAVNSAVDAKMNQALPSAPGQSGAGNQYPR